MMKIEAHQSNGMRVSKRWKGLTVMPKGDAPSGGAAGRRAEGKGMSDELLRPYMYYCPKAAMRTAQPTACWAMQEFFFCSALRINSLTPSAIHGAVMWDTDNQKSSVTFHPLFHITAACLIQTNKKQSFTSIKHVHTQTYMCAWNY